MLHEINHLHTGYANTNYETMHLSNLVAIERSNQKILSDIYWIQKSVRHQVFYGKLYVGGARIRESYYAFSCYAFFLFLECSENNNFEK